MKHATFAVSAFQAALAAVCAVALALAGLSAITRYDNKYSIKAKLTQDGFCVIPEKGACTLADGWELYPDALLSPDDFRSETPPFYNVWAGEYANLSFFHEDKNPYGAATWRLRLRGKGNVMFYLPEPLCAAKVFVNGECLGGPGDVSFEHYSPLIQDTAYSFLLDDEAELIVQTANYSHYYGGIWYAPLIGDAGIVARLVAWRMIFYGLLFFPSLALSLFCVTLWIRKRFDPAAFYFGMLSLSFALRICYPFLRLSGAPSVSALYALEDAAAMAGIYFTIRILFLLFFPDSFRRLKKTLCALSLGACAASAVLPLSALLAFPGLMRVYGPLVSWYKVIMALFLAGLTAFGCLTGVSNMKTALAAMAANNACLLYDVLTAGYYEPIIGAYPEEYGAFCMVIAFAALMMRRGREMAEENQRLNLRLKEEVQEKTEHLQKLLTERGQLIAELGHDMKSPLTSLSNMAQIIRLNDILLDTQTRERIITIEEQCGILSERLKSIQEIVKETSDPLKAKPVDLNSFLSDFYQNCRPVIELYGPNFLAKITPRPCRVMADPERLFRALENLLYNAADFTPQDGTVTLSLDEDGAYAKITLSDTGCGISKKDLPHIFRRSFSTRKDKGGQGLGLAIARAIVLEHAGTIEASSEEGKGTTFVIRLPLVL